MAAVSSIVVVGAIVVVVVVVVVVVLVVVDGAGVVAGTVWRKLNFKSTGGGWSF